MSELESCIFIIWSPHKNGGVVAIEPLVANTTSATLQVSLRLVWTLDRKIMIRFRTSHASEVGRLHGRPTFKHSHLGALAFSISSIIHSVFHSSRPFHIQSSVGEGPYEKNKSPMYQMFIPIPKILKTQTVHSSIIQYSHTWNWFFVRLGIRTCENHLSASSVCFSSLWFIINNPVI